MKKEKNKLIKLFLITFLILNFSFLIATSVSAVTFKPQVTLGSFIKNSAIEIKPDSIGQYILSAYNYLIGSVGILATVVMMYAGILWITAAGNQEQIGKAKGYIASSLTGLVLALCSWMILYTVNPDLVSMKSITPLPVSKKPDSTPGCCKSNSGARDAIADDCKTDSGEQFFSGYKEINGTCQEVSVCCLYRNNNVLLCEDTSSATFCRNNYQNAVPYMGQTCVPPDGRTNRLSWSCGDKPTP